MTAGCGPSSDSSSPPATSEPRSAAEAAARDASTNLDVTPLSQADVTLYVNVMGGASALARSLSPADRELLEFAKKVDAGQVKPTTADEAKLAQARALTRKDDELATIQGIDARYRVVRDKIEALIGPAAKPPFPDDPVTRENIRFLEARRATIERLQADVRDPLSRKN